MFKRSIKKSLPPTFSLNFGRQKFTKQNLFVYTNMADENEPIVQCVHLDLMRVLDEL